MATTSLGIPKYAQTDNADIASKLNAIADQVNALLLSRSFTTAARRVIRTDGAKFTVVAGTDKMVTSFNSSATNVGNIAYSGGILTPADGGLYIASVHTSWPAQSGSSFYARGVGLYVGGSRASGLMGFSNYTANLGEGVRSYQTTSLITVPAGADVQVFMVTAGPNEDVLVTDFSLARVA